MTDRREYVQQHGRAKIFVLWVILGWAAVRGAYILSQMAAPPSSLLPSHSDGFSSPTSLDQKKGTGNGMIMAQRSDADDILGEPIALPAQHAMIAWENAGELQRDFGISDANILAMSKLTSPVLAGSPQSMRTDRMSTYQSLETQSMHLNRMTHIARLVPASGSTADVNAGRSKLRVATDVPGIIPDAYIPAARPMQRFSLDGWALLRGKVGIVSAPSLAPAGQYGGSQAGLRIGYRLDDAGGVTAFARVSRPLRGAGGAEAAVGLSVRPLQKIPVQFAVEQRIALEKGGRNAMAAYVAGGYGPQTIQSGIAKGVEIETYGQIGIVGARRRDKFADGMLRAAVPIQLGSSTSLAVGGAAWGGAQPGVSRVDVGPQVQYRGQSGDARYRLSIDWRERVSGRAQPGSGVAITLTAGF